MAARRPLALPAVVLVALVTGCATTELSGREVLRVAPLRDEAVRPAAIDGAPVLLDAGADALTDDELSAIAGRLPAHFEARLEAHGDALAKDSRVVGTARVVRCKVRAGAGRRNTVYRAHCRVTLEVDGASLVEVEASATRLRGPRAVTEEEAARIATLVRNPLLSADDSEEALKSALDHAARLLTTRAALGENDDANEDARAENAPAVDEGAIRRVALRNATKEGYAERLSAAADLARWGESEDGLALLPLLDDARPRVRQATALALGELGTKEAWEPLRAHRNDDDAGVREAIETALKRLGALYPELRAPSDGASNSSTPGAEVSGET